jgi:hypothetical protein
MITREQIRRAMEEKGWTPDTPPEVFAAEAEANLATLDQYLHDSAVVLEWERRKPPAERDLALLQALADQIKRISAAICGENLEVAALLAEEVFKEMRAEQKGEMHS